ncbi:MAG: type II CAAX endopeptidase family protein [Acidobacteriota bacterium]
MRPRTSPGTRFKKRSADALIGCGQPSRRVRLRMNSGGSVRPGPRPPEGLLLLALSGLLFLVAALVAPPEIRGGAALALTAGLSIGGFLLPSILWARLRGFSSLAFPLRRPGPKEMAAALCFVAGGSLLALSAAAWFSRLPGAGQEDEALRAFLSSFPIGVQWLAFALVPAVCEESLFRGALLATLREFPALPACLLSGAAFGLFHGSLYRFLPVAILGASLAAVVLRTGNLALAVLGHAAHNGVVLAALHFGHENGHLMEDAGWVWVGAALGGTAILAAGLRLSGSRSPS